MDPKPSWVVHADDVPEEEGHYRAPFDAEKLSFSRELGRAMGAVKLGMSRERLPPGRRTSFTHAHSLEEELVYVLEGECMLRVVRAAGSRQARSRSAPATRSPSWPARGSRTAQ